MSTVLAGTDMAALCEYTFGVTLWSKSREIIRSVMRPHSKTVVKACHSSSKTHTAAQVTALTPILGGDVVTTGPTDLQVEKQLWGDVHKLIVGSRVPTSEWGTLNLKELKLATGEWAIGFTTKAEDNGVRFQGFHAREGSFLVVIVDEALGVSPAIYEAIEGIAAGGDVRRLYLCNPTIPSGPIYDIFEDDDPSWNRITIDAFDTPNLAGLTLDELLRMPEHELYNNPVPYLTTRHWVVEKYHEWGEDNPKWQSRVRGQFPDQATNALFASPWLDAAKARPAAYSERGGAVVAGVDVAGPGKDETVVYVRQGVRVLEVHPFPDADARGKVLKALQPWLHKGLKRVNVDSAGDGHYFTLHLRDHLPKVVEVNGINVGESASDVPDKDGKTAKEEFANKKAELYWHLREQFKSGMVSGLTDPLTIRQLKSLLWAPNEKGLTEIESKKQAAKRGVDSPDRAEALMLCFAPSSQDMLLARAWNGQAQQTMTPQEQRFHDITSGNGQTSQPGGWLSAARWE